MPCTRPPPPASLAARSVAARSQSQPAPQRPTPCCGRGRPVDLGEDTSNRLHHLATTRDGGACAAADRRLRCFFPQCCWHRCVLATGLLCGSVWCWHWVLLLVSVGPHPVCIGVLRAPARRGSWAACWPAPRFRNGRLGTLLRVTFHGLYIPAPVPDCGLSQVCASVSVYFAFSQSLSSLRSRFASAASPLMA